MSLVLLLVFVLLLGVVCGLRSMIGPAVICWGAHLGWLQLDHSRLAFLHTIVSLVVFTVLALGELVADKLPKTGARTAPGPLAVRFISGALCGAALCLSASRPVVAGIIGGGVGAIAGSFGGYRVRHWLTTARALPDFPIAATEDLIALALGLLVVSRFMNPAIVPMM